MHIYLIPEPVENDSNIRVNVDRTLYKKLGTPAYEKEFKHLFNGFINGRLLHTK